MNEYEEVLAEWAAKYTGHALRDIEKVEVIHDPGYHYSSWTFEDPHTEVYVRLKDGTKHIVGYDSGIENMGDLLTQLLEIASRKDFDSA